MGRQEQASTGMRLLVARRITEQGDPHILAPDPPALGGVVRPSEARCSVQPGQTTRAARRTEAAAGSSWIRDAGAAAAGRHQR